MTTEDKKPPRNIIDEGRLGILLALSYFKSLNMSHLAKFTNKTRPTITHHIKTLQKSKIIELDNDNALKAGKYFKLSSKGKKMLDMRIKDVEEKQIKLDYRIPSSYNTFAAILKTTSNIVKNVTHSLAYYMETHKNELAEKSSFEKPDLLAHISTMTYNIKIYSDKQRDKFLNAFDNLYMVMKEIEEENEDTKSEDYDIYFMHSFAAPVSIIDPNQKNQ